MTTFASLVHSGSHIHLVGIKGVAMTALAQCLLDQGCVVSGSDVEEEFVTSNLLKQLPISMLTPFRAEHVQRDIQAVVFTGAHQGRKNPEVQAAMALGIPVFSHAVALGQLTEGTVLTAVCGVGGKTTTSAMLSYVLHSMDAGAGFAVGVGNIPQLRKTGAMSIGCQRFVAEADEYVVEPGFDHTPRFLYLLPQTIICTNIAYDHPDVYPDVQATKQAYLGFFSKLEQQPNGLLVWNADDELSKEVVAQIPPSIRKMSIGTSPAAKVKIDTIQTFPGSTRVRYAYKEKQYSMTLHLPGEYNVRNALAAWAVAVEQYAVPEDQAIELLSRFTGTMRRFEFVGTFGKQKLYDDYAHHPAELRSVIEAMRAWEPDKKIICVFQPHTYSRTKQLKLEFIDALERADLCYLLDIYPSAREQYDSSITSQQLVDALLERGKVAVLSGTISQTVELLRAKKDEDYVVLTLGAGDVYQVNATLLEQE